MVRREVGSANGEDRKMGRTFIYSRVSTGGQDAANQTTNLKQQFPHAEVVEEIASGGKSRPALEKLVQEQWLLTSKFKALTINYWSL